MVFSDKKVNGYVSYTFRGTTFNQESIKDIIDKLRDLDNENRGCARFFQRQTVEDGNYYLLPQFRSLSNQFKI